MAPDSAPYHLVRLARDRQPPHVSLKGDALAVAGVVYGEGFSPAASPEVRTL